MSSPKIGLYKAINKITKSKVNTRFSESEKRKIIEEYLNSDQSKSAVWENTPNSYPKMGTYLDRRDNLGIKISLTVKKTHISLQSRNIKSFRNILLVTKPNKIFGKNTLAIHMNVEEY